MRPNYTKLDDKTRVKIHNIDITILTDCRIQQIKGCILFVKSLSNLKQKSTEEILECNAVLIDILGLR